VKTANALLALATLVLAPPAVTPLVWAQGRGNREQNEALAGVIVHERGGAVVIRSVLKDSPAAKAGLRSGDVLLRVGERKIARHNDVDRAIAGLPAGSKLKIVYERESKPVTVSLTLVARRGFKSDYLKGVPAASARGSRRRRGARSRG